MNIPLRSRFSRVGMIAAMLSTVLSGIAASPASADQVNSAAPSITFAAAVPVAPGRLPLYSLHAAAVPQLILHRALLEHQVTPFQTEEKVLTARDVATHYLRSYVNPSTNEFAVIPNLSHAISHRAGVQPRVIATALFRQENFLPHDLTSYTVSPEIPVQGAAVSRPTAGDTAARVISASNVRFTFVAAHRYAAGFPVYGLGSHAVLAIGPDGSVQGLLRRWKTASANGSVSNRLNADRVRAAIRAQLAPFAAHNAIAVDRIAVVYYDGNGALLQPAYRFTAVLHPTQGPAANAHIAGYIPIAQTAEAIPSLLSLRTAAAQPLTPQKTDDQAILQRYSMRARLLMPQRSVTQLKHPLYTFGNINSEITLGEYANRDNTLNGMADQFLTGLTMHPLFFPSFGPPIVRTQYYYAYPWEVVGPYSAQFMNAVNIAYTQPHGDWYENTTYSNYADFWNVHDIGTNGNPGFGAAAGGKLATWIIDSCEVVPSMYDLGIATGNPYDAFTPWWPVFQGLHNVIGFRTEMWLYDGLNVPFGFAAQLGGDLNAAWFQEIAADPAYNDGYTYYDPHIKQNVHMGRASTFIDGRDLGHSIYDVAPQTASTTLWNFWMGN